MNYFDETKVGVGFFMGKVKVAAKLDYQVFLLSAEIFKLMTLGRSLRRVGVMVERL
jgi:hypothetical protein